MSQHFRNSGCTLNCTYYFIILLLHCIDFYILIKFIKINQLNICKPGKITKSFFTAVYHLVLPFLLRVHWVCWCFAVFFCTWWTHWEVHANIQPQTRQPFHDSIAYSTSIKVGSTPLSQLRSSILNHYFMTHHFLTMRLPFPAFHNCWRDGMRQTEAKGHTSRCHTPFGFPQISSFALEDVL